MTVAMIELMDLSLSLDNVVAAVALDRRLWVVCLGVFIGIVCLRFVAGFCIRLIEKHPVLKSTAFLLVGFVGALLLVELALAGYGIHHIPFGIKFGGIAGIVAGSLIYERRQKLAGVKVRKWVSEKRPKDYRTLWGVSLNAWWLGWCLGLAAVNGWAWAATGSACSAFVCGLNIGGAMLWCYALGTERLVAGDCSTSPSLGDRAERRR
jgi:hypothetical protein